MTAVLLLATLSLPDTRASLHRGISIAYCKGLSAPCAEIGAVGGALAGQSSAEHFLALQSVKSVYGHTEGTAGRPLAASS